MIRTAVAGAFAASLLMGVAPSAQAQGLGSLGNVFNCNRTGSQQTPGALIGGVLGGLAGAGVARNDALGAIVGGALGAAAGSYLGCSMGDRDQASLEDATLRALNENRSTTWNNPSTGASARINVYADTSTPSYGYNNNTNAPRYGTWMSPTQVRLDNRVSTASGFETVAPRYVALNQTYIRTAPRSNAPTAGMLSRNQEFEVLAKVQNQPWLLVGRNGVGVGYVPTASARANAYGESVTSTNFSAQPISANSLRLNRNVAWAASYETAPELFTVRSTGNLRASPSTQARSIGQVYRGDEIQALARVRGTNWVLVGRNGQGIGYVHDSVLDVQQPSYAPAYSNTNTTQASAECRIVEQVLTTREYAAQTQRLRACRTSGGTWSFTQI